MAERSEVLPTPFVELNERTGGGLRFGTCVGLVGAPDAGKSSIAKQWALHYAKAGHAVGMLLNDEPVRQTLVRLGQELGLERAALDRGDPNTLASLASAFRELPSLQFADCDDDECTVEQMSEALFASRNRPGILFIDSAQTCHAEGSRAAASRKDHVDAVMAACRRARQARGHLVVFTSEMGRAHYSARGDDMAAGKDSGSLEYAAQVLLTLRPGRAGAVRVALAKNKLGGKAPFTLLHDRVRACFLDAAENAGDAVLDGVRQAALRARIVEITRSHCLGSANAIHGAIRGQRALVLALVREMIEAGELRKDERGDLRPSEPSEERPLC